MTQNSNEKRMSLIFYVVMGVALTLGLTLQVAIIHNELLPCKWRWNPTYECEEATND